MSIENIHKNDEALDRLISALESRGVKKYGRNKLIAEKTGMNSNYLSEVFSGKGELTDKTIKHICSAFQLSENWVRTGEGEMVLAPKIAEPPEVFGPGKDPLIHEMLSMAEQAMERIPIEERRRLALKFLEQVEGFCHGENGKMSAGSQSTKKRDLSTK